LCVTILNFWASEITADLRGSPESLREKRQTVFVLLPVVLATTLQYDEYEQESGCGVWRERHVTKRCLAVLGEEERV
jgi:hypothetical protein